jgi:hypothetical protein
MVSPKKMVNLFTDEEPTRPESEMSQVMSVIRQSRKGGMTRWLTQVISRQVLFKVHSVLE